MKVLQSFHIRKLLEYISQSIELYRKKCFNFKISVLINQGSRLRNNKNQVKIPFKKKLREKKNIFNLKKIEFSSKANL